LKDEEKSPHHAIVLEIERGKSRDHLYKTVMALKVVLPQPGNEATRRSIGRDDPEEKTPTTVEGMEKLKP
jgi:hypothetical protein